MEYDYKKMFSLDGKVAIVTGGASGLGFAMAKCYASAGAKVFITGTRDQASLDASASEIGFGCEGIQYDISDEKKHKVIIEDIIKKSGRIDIIVSNAGVHCKKDIEDITKDDFDKVLSIHVIGAFGLIQAAVPYMKENKWGRIVNISSSQAFLTTETYSAYAASKAAVSHLTRIWGNELAKDNILVNALCPCFVQTPMMVNSIARIAEELGTDTEGGYNYFADLIPLHRLLEIEEIGNWAVMLCGELGNATTGSNISITCGQVRL